MEFGINKKIKVVWICHFSNNSIQKKLKVRKKISEFAPWISLGIEEVRKRNDIELHIISPHRWISGKKEFIIDNIYYHFFNSGIPFYGRHWTSFFRFDLITNYYFNKLSVRKFVNSIKPDIIHLHGLENAYYSSTILQFLNRIPVIATIQGFISLQNTNDNFSKENAYRIKIEKEILRSIKNVGVRTEAMKHEVLKYNKEAIFFWHEYFLNTPTIKNPISENEKKYDLIFFARVTKDKGVEDLIIATGILIENFPQIKVAIIGGANIDYLNTLKQLVAKNKCVKNIDFLGFLPKQEDVYEVLMKSKVCVLPTYNDIIPGTIIESMFRRVPVVSYKTGGIPNINLSEENILLSDQGDINGLVSNITKLLDNKEYRLNLGAIAFEYANERWNNKKAMEDVYIAYKTILDIN